MPTTVCLQVDGVDLDVDTTLQVIGEQLSDAVWMSVDGSVTASVEPTGRDLASDVIDFARLVERYLPGSKVRRVHRDLVTASDIAARTGFSRESVRKWAQPANGRGFPAPFATVGGDDRPSKLWLWPDVATWLASTYAYPIDQDWPDEVTVAHIEACLARVPDYTSQQWHHAPDPDELVARMQSFVTKHLLLTLEHTPRQLRQTTVCSPDLRIFDRPGLTSSVTEYASEQFCVAG